MDAMKKLFLFLWMMVILLPLGAQEQYISKGRYTPEDRFEDLGGGGGILLLSKHRDLVVTLTNVKPGKFKVTPNGERPDGYYEYIVSIHPGSTRTPKLEISRRGSVYKTEIVQTTKPDFLMAYKVEEVANPIRMDEQTMANDTSMDPLAAILEFTTSIQNLQVDFLPELGATVEREKSAADPNIVIIRAKISIAVLDEARKRMEELREQCRVQDVKTSVGEQPQEEWDKLDSLENELREMETHYAMLTTVNLYTDGSNRLSIDISGLEGRMMKCYAVLPVVIEKNVYVTECSAFMSEAARLFGMRQYKAARAAYEDAWNAKDVVPTLRPAIRESIAQCDSCLLYEHVASGAIKEIARLKKSGNATQEEVARFASAAVEFMEMANAYNPCDFYADRIERMKKLLVGLPLKVKFTVVEWKTLSEGEYIPGVEVWAYKGDASVSSQTFSSDKRFKNIVEKEGANYVQVGTSGEGGIVEIELNRADLPKGLLFRPKEDSGIKMKYLTVNELMHQAKGTYMEKQFRLKMYKK